ncbi:MAG: hypothetical protein P8J32_05730 [bacterium]|nr:hypothetical protein [bacterium]
MILGLDISTTCIGYSLFSEDGDLLKIGCVKMRPKQTIFEKLKHFEEHMEEISTMNVTHVSIEEPLKKFAGKFSSATTIALLNFFNGMISAVCYRTWGVEPVYYNVNSARKTAYPHVKFGRKSSEGKTQVWEEVSKLEPHLNWKYGPRSRKLVDENFDMCDAYTVGLCHLITLEKQAALLKD